MRIGVLALQGAFREHNLMLKRLNVEVVEVRLPEDLEGLSGLIIPGGESTTIAKLLKIYKLDTAIPEFYKQGKAIWGTCAGAITIARDIVGFPEQATLGLMDTSVERNAYGRQVDSFEIDIDVKGLKTPFRAVFIRAPMIARLGSEVNVLARYEDKAIMVQQEKLLATVFHPELSNDTRVHEYFLRLCE